MITPLALLIASMSTTVQGPDRLFNCTMGKVANMAAKSEAELGLVGSHPLLVLQPDGAVEYADLPPRGKKGVQLLKFSEPDHVLPTRFISSITDTWPQKIELQAILPNRQRMFVTFGSIDAAAGSAIVSAGLIDDASETIVPGTFYQGKCHVEMAPQLAAKYETLKAAAEKEATR